MELLFPEVEERSGTAFADRKSRLRLANKVERTLDYAGETFDRVHEEIDKNEEGIEQREWDDLDEWRWSDVRAREREDDREDVRLGLEILDRNQARAHRNVYLALAVLTTLAAIVLAYMAAKHGKVGYAGVSAFTTALSGVFIRLMWLPSGAEDGAADPKPYPWSVLIPRKELDEESSEDGS